MAADLLRLFRTLATEKQALRKREEKVVADLREVLARLGYRLEPIRADGASSPRSRVR